MTVQNYIFSVFLGIYSDDKIRFHSKIETSTVFFCRKEGIHFVRPR